MLELGKHSKKLQLKNLLELINKTSTIDKVHVIWQLYCKHTFKNTNS